MTIKYYNDAPGWGWDTDICKWIRPSIKQMDIAQDDENNFSWENSTYKEILFHLYKTGRDSIGWETLFGLHDDEDKNYFLMLDKMVGRK